MRRTPLLAAFPLAVAALAACKSGGGDSQVKDFADTDTISNNFDGTFAVTCAEGRFQNGKKDAVVTKAQLSTVCEERTPGGNGGITIGGGTTPGALASCANVPPALKSLTVIVADLGDQNLLCFGFVNTMAGYFRRFPLLAGQLAGNPATKILVGVAGTPPRYDGAANTLTTQWEITPQYADQLSAELRPRFAAAFSNDALPTLKATFDANFAAVSAAVGSRVPLNFDASDQIVNGGNGLFANGNILNTSAQNRVPYNLNNVSSGSNAFGPQVKYATVGRDGQFYLMVVQPKISFFEVGGATGNHPAGRLVTVDSGGARGFVRINASADGRQVHHQMIIVPAALASARQEPVNNINDRSCQQRVSGLDNADYLFYAYSARDATMTDDQLRGWLDATVNGAFLVGATRTQPDGLRGDQGGNPGGPGRNPGGPNFPPPQPPPPTQPLPPPCPTSLSCDPCSQAGSQTCRTVDCRGAVVNTAQQACTPPPPQFRCGNCSPKSVSGVCCKWSYPVFANGNQIELAGESFIASQCGDAQIRDTRCGPPTCASGSLDSDCIGKHLGDSCDAPSAHPGRCQVFSTGSSLFCQCKR